MLAMQRPMTLLCVQKFRNYLTLKRTSVDLAYKIHGGKPSQGKDSPIFVLHGLLGSKKNWESMSKRLAESTNRSVVAVDARNHGESPHDHTHTYFDLADDVSQLMDKLSVTESVVVGHSMGGRTAMLLALTKPTKVNRLVVVDVSPINSAGIENNFFPTLLDIMKTVSFEGVTNTVQARALARKKIEASGLVMGNMHFILMNVGHRYDKTIGWMCNVDTLRREFVTIGTFPEEMNGRQYHGPTLFIGGELSNYIPPSDIAGIQKFFPNAELKYVPGVGHNVHAEDANTFHDIVHMFLSK